VPPLRAVALALAFATGGCTCDERPPSPGAGLREKLERAHRDVAPLRARAAADAPTVDGAR
jgi:hypothetical protein